MKAVILLIMILALGAMPAMAEPPWMGPHQGAGMGNSPYQTPHKAVTTPYGDFCERCSKYGMGLREVRHEEAVMALTEYFHEKGLLVRNMSGRGRFLKVDIYRGEFLVDRVLFDRMTGRVRSIY